MKTESSIASLLLILAGVAVAVHGFAGSDRASFVLVGRTISSARQKRTLLPKLHGQSSSSHGGLFGDNEDDKSAGNRPRNQKTPTLQHLTGRFAAGAELLRLRADLLTLRENLHWAEALHDVDRMNDLHKAIQKGERRDPAVVYLTSVQQLAVVQADATLSQPEKQAASQPWAIDAAAARACLPQFQLEGLWVGNYGDHGNELLNVTYVGDTLVATKVTGDVSVPRGQISFSVDLSPRNSSATLEPLKLSFDSSAASAKLPRFLGKGQIAKPGFIDNKYVDGQLILFERHFSFVWLPTKDHVLFRRPAAEQTLSMLRNVISKEDELENMRHYLQRCFAMDRTESLARQYTSPGGTEPFRRISLQEDLESLDTNISALASANNSAAGGQDGDGSRFNFWNVQKWREYIDGVLSDDNGSGGGGR